MLAFVRTRPVLSYYVLAFAIASAVVAFAVWRATQDPATVSAIGQMVSAIYRGHGYINVLSIGAAALRTPILLTIFAYALAPTIAALVVASLGAGGGLKRLLRRLNPIGPEGNVRGAVVLYIGLLAFYALGLFAYSVAAGPGADPYWRLKSVGGAVLVGAVVGLFLDEGGSLEELGWRGFAWPNLQGSMRSPVAAVLLLGVLHWGWHLPREVFTFLGGAPIGGWIEGQAVFLLLCLCLAVVAVFCVNKSGGSVWPAVFVHGGSNVWSKATQDVSSDFGFLDPRLVIFVVAAALILIFARKELGRRV